MELQIQNGRHPAALPNCKNDSIAKSFKIRVGANKPYLFFNAAHFLFSIW